MNETLRSACLYVCMSVCLSVCLLVYLHDIFYVVAWSSSADTAICYLFPVLLMSSSFHIMKPVSQNQGQRYVSSSSSGGGTGGDVAVYDCRLV